MEEKSPSVSNINYGRTASINNHGGTSNYNEGLLEIDNYVIIGKNKDRYLITTVGGDKNTKIGGKIVVWYCNNNKEENPSKYIGDITSIGGGRASFTSDKVKITISFSSLDVKSLEIEKDGIKVNINDFRRL